jgi:hypothetical protein
VSNACQQRPFGMHATKTSVGPIDSGERVRSSEAFERTCQTPKEDTRLDVSCAETGTALNSLDRMNARPSV